MKVVVVFVNPVLFAFSFSLAMGHTAFTTLADRAVHVLGQFQHFNQICKLLHGKCMAIWIFAQIRSIEKFRIVVSSNRFDIEKPASMLEAG